MTIRFYYILSCKTDLGATGTVRLESKLERLIGDLRVKMGDKTMSSSQQVEPNWLNSCDEFGRAAVSSAENAGNVTSDGGP